MTGDEPWIPISALQHFVYCERQCALIHVERVFAENRSTSRGRRVHERADQSAAELHEGIHLERALPLRAPQLGLSGRADVVEFLADGTPYPIEYKSGARKRSSADEVQLGAQAMALEEMTGCEVPEGSLFYARSRRRRRVTFDEDLRNQVREVIEAVRGLMASRTLPEPVADTRCDDCSLFDMCMPYTIRGWSSSRDRASLFEPMDAS